MIALFNSAVTKCRSALRSSLMCLRGSRSSSGSPGVPAAVDLVVAEGHLATSSEQ